MTAQEHAHRMQQKLVNANKAGEWVLKLGVTMVWHVLIVVLVQNFKTSLSFFISQAKHSCTVKSTPECKGVAYKDKSGTGQGEEKGELEEWKLYNHTNW